MFRSASLSCAILTAALALAARRMPRRPKARASPITPDRHGKNKDNRDSSGSVSVTLSTAGISISTARGYAVQAGATGYGSLPPGIRKNLARGKPMPPGIAKKWCRRHAGAPARAPRL